MNEVKPWHSIKENIYHVNLLCKDGTNLDSADIREGTGNKPLCSECKKLNLGKVISIDPHKLNTNIFKR